MSKKEKTFSKGATVAGKQDMLKGEDQMENFTTAIATGNHTRKQKKNAFSNCQSSGQYEFNGAIKL